LFISSVPHHCGPRGLSWGSVYVLMIRTLLSLAVPGFYTRGTHVKKPVTTKPIARTDVQSSESIRIDTPPKAKTPKSRLPTRRPTNNSREVLRLFSTYVAANKVSLRFVPAHLQGLATLLASLSLRDSTCPTREQEHF